MGEDYKKGYYIKNREKMYITAKEGFPNFHDLKIMHKYINFGNHMEEHFIRRFSLWNQKY